MHDTVIVALITASGSVLVAITALLLNYQGFSHINQRLRDFDQRMIDFTGAINELDKRLTRVEVKIGIQP
jgi:signal transduction histidine kinase